MKGMKVMVTENVETDLNITNGARGTIVGIVCHPDEQTHRTSKLPHLEESVIPIQPASRTLRIKLKENGKDVICSVRCRQFPMTAAYAFMDADWWLESLQSIRGVVPKSGEISHAVTPRL